MHDSALGRRRGHSHRRRALPCAADVWSHSARGDGGLRQRPVSRARVALGSAGHLRHRGCDRWAHVVVPRSLGRSTVGRDHAQGRRGESAVVRAAGYGELLGRRRAVSRR